MSQIIVFPLKQALMFYHKKILNYHVPLDLHSNHQELRLSKLIDQELKELFIQSVSNQLYLFLSLSHHVTRGINTNSHTTVNS